MDMWVRPFHDPDGTLLGFYGACRPARTETPAPTTAGPGVKGTAAWPTPSAEDLYLKEKLAAAETDLVALRALLDQKDADHSPFQQAPVMLWACDEDGAFTAVNQAWEQARHRPADEECGEGWLEAVPSAEERQNLRETLRKATGEENSVQLRFHWVDGADRQRLVELHGTPLRDEEGIALGLSGTLRDVTEDHEALASIREYLAPGTGDEGTLLVSDLLHDLSRKLPSWTQSQSAASADLESFREIFDHVGTGIVLLGPDNKPIFANRRHRELLGFGIEDAGDMEAWLSQSCNDQEHSQAVLKIWQEDIWRRQLTKVVALKNARGALRDIKIEPQLFLDDNRLLLTIQDVTEAHRSEEAMRDSEIRFRALFRESSMGIALIDGEEKIYDINPALERILDIPRRQLLCRHFDECVLPEDLPRKQSLVKELLHSPKRSAQLELRLASLKETAGSEDEVWVRLHISLVRDVDQRVLFTAYFVQDITEQKRVQAELAVSQEQNRALLEIIPDLILLVDRTGEVIDLMPGEESILKLPEPGTVGARIHDMIPAFRGQFEALMEQAYTLDDVVPFAFSTGEEQDFVAKIVACKPDSAVVTIQRSKTSGAGQRRRPLPGASGGDPGRAEAALADRSTRPGCGDHHQLLGGHSRLESCGRGALRLHQERGGGSTLSRSIRRGFPGRLDPAPETRRRESLGGGTSFPAQESIRGNRHGDLPSAEIRVWGNGGSGRLRSVRGSGGNGERVGRPYARRRQGPARFRSPPAPGSSASAQ